MIDLLNLQPTVISRDLRSKYILIYGQPKHFGHLLSNQYLNRGKNLGKLNGTRKPIRGEGIQE